MATAKKTTAAKKMMELTPQEEEQLRAIRDQNAKIEDVSVQIQDLLIANEMRLVVNPNSLFGDYKIIVVPAK